MSDPRETRVPGTGTEEPFLERWSRRKRQAREGVDDEAGAGEPVAGEPPAPAAAAPGEPPAVTELPDLESLGEHSDYSAFMAPGVDESLRRQALRKLFRSPKFNVCDGLDDYCDDFTQWVPLGGVITADMRHHLERAAKLAEQVGEEAGPRRDVEPAPESAAAASAAEPSTDGGGQDDPAADETEREA